MRSHVKLYVYTRTYTYIIIVVVVVAFAYFVITCTEHLSSDDGYTTQQHDIAVYCITNRWIHIDKQKTKHRGALSVSDKQRVKVHASELMAMIAQVPAPIGPPR